VKPADLERFEREQLACNIATRGWLEPNYWQLGVEGNLRYMSQMGGWSILDYGLHQARDPFPYLRLGYAAFLSSWALVNAGTPESNWGFWYPGEENDGAAGSAYVPQAYGGNWFGKEQPRGAWQYSGEIDLGFMGALRSAATIVADDPLLGLVAYGGRLRKSRQTIEVVPEDGLRRRFHAVFPGQSLHLQLDREAFAPGRPILIDATLDEISFQLENAAPAHPAGIDHSGTYRLMVDGRPVREAAPGRFLLDMDGRGPIRVVLRRDGPSIRRPGRI
jgi:hypothetical protein